MNWVIKRTVPGLPPLYLSRTGHWQPRGPMALINNLPDKETAENLVALMRDKEGITVEMVPWSY